MLHVVVGEEKQQKNLRPPMQQDNCMEPWTWSSQHQSPRLMNVVKQLGYFFHTPCLKCIAKYVVFTKVHGGAFTSQCIML